MSRFALISKTLLATSGGTLIALALLASSQSIQSAEGGDPKSGFECMLEPRMVVKLGAQASGILAQVLVDRGDRVRSGQAVAMLESTVEAHNVSVARWRAENEVEIQLAEEASALENSRFSRRSALWTSKTVSEENFEKARSDAKLRALEIERAKYAREQARLEAARAQALLDIRTIKSPVDGIVTSRKMSPGEFVRDESQIMEIAVIDPLYVHAFLPAAAFRRVKIGTVGRVVLEDAIGGTYEAPITVKDPVIDAASSTFLTRLHLANPSYIIPSGVRCRVQFD
jgi:RND family efflux transporter MFP subunit